MVSSNIEMQKIKYIWRNFFFINPATTDIYTLSLHDALPIYCGAVSKGQASEIKRNDTAPSLPAVRIRSEEHTSELQSHSDLVCRLLLEKKNTWVNDLIPMSKATYAQLIKELYRENWLIRGTI